MKKYLVTGATSHVGRQVVDTLIGRKVPVRVLVRRNSDAGHFARLGADVVQGDVRDRKTAGRACRGVDTVVSLMGRHYAGKESGMWDIDVHGNENLIHAVKNAGGRRFVLLSVLWADRDLPPVIFRVKRTIEQILMGSGLDWTILRPSTFDIGPNSLVGVVGPTIERYGMAFIPGPDSKPVSFISVHDLSDAIVAAALDTGSEGRIYELGGLEAITIGEGARRIASVLRRKVRLVGLPRASLRILRGIARRIGFGAYEGILFYEMLADHGFSTDVGGSQLRELLGRDPTPIDASLRGYYSRIQKTPWRDSLYGSLLFRNR